MDLVRRNLITPKAIREMVEIINEDIRLRAERQGPDLAQATARVRRLEREDANLRRALRTATPRAAERIQLEVDAVADELSQAKARLDRLEEVHQPMRITPKLIRETIEEMSGLIEHAGLTRGWPGSVTCSSGSTSTAARSTRWRSGRPQTTRVLTARIQ